MKPAFKSTRPTIAKNRIIIGRKPLEEALHSGTSIEKIFILKSIKKEELHPIKKLAQSQHVPLTYVPAEKLNRFTRANHQGIVAIAGLISYQPLQEIISRAVDKGETPLVVISDGVTDTRNLGAIARSAYCYGAHALVIPTKNNAAVTEDAVKTSAGALEHLPVCKVSTVHEALTTCRLNGLQIIASDLNTDHLITSVDFTIPTALIIGAEDKGVSGSVLKNADQIIKIPMTANFESLNVAVATGILLYEAYRQNNL